MEPQHSPHPARPALASGARPRRTILVVSDPRPPEDVLSYHAKGGERKRLARTQELVRRHLPPPPVGQR